MYKRQIYDNSEKILATIPETIKLGYTEYNEYRDDPNSSRVIEKFLVSTQIAPEGMWEKAKEIADDNFMKTKLFWEEFNPKCNDLKPLTEIISFKWNIIKKLPNTLNYTIFDLLNISGHLKNNKEELASNWFNCVASALWLEYQFKDECKLAGKFMRKN